MEHSTLNESLLKALSQLPDSRTFHLYTVISEPVRDQDIFLYAPQRPKAHARHILVLLAHQSSTSPPQRVFVGAIEAFLYTIPSTNSSLLYISKVDSTGQGSSIRPNPTKRLVTAFLAYFSSPSTRPTPYLWIHVFARAQNQYMFPNSAEYSGKRVLRDVNLCKWWKEALEQGTSAESQLTRLFYTLPGYSSFEANAMLHKTIVAASGPPFGTSAASSWTYGHPYKQSVAPLPSGPIGDDVKSALDSPYSIAQLIPSLPDDPKARFLDEIASTPHEEPDSRPALPSSPPRPSKRARVASPDTLKDTLSRSKAPASSATQGGVGKAKGKGTQITPAAQRALASVSIEEFWERMAFRQECSQGAVTGFFTAILVPPPAKETSSSSTILPNTVPGLDPSSATSKTPLAPTTTRLDPTPFSPDVQLPGQQPTAVLERILTTLLNLDFGSTEKAIRATRVVEDSIRAMCGGGQGATEKKDDQGAYEETTPMLEPITSSPSAPVPPSSLSSNVSAQRPSLTSDSNKEGPQQIGAGTESKSDGTQSDVMKFAQSTHAVQPVTAAMDSRGGSSPFELYIYGSITTNNPPLPPTSSTAAAGGNGGGEPIITVLQVRKKKRPAPAAVPPASS